MLQMQRLLAIYCVAGTLLEMPAETARNAQEMSIRRAFGAKSNRS
jgi:hypothetical protein